CYILRGIQICVMHIFFFQAEDGIRDRNVTGVQTCALPILSGRSFLKLLDYTPDEIRYLIKLSKEFKNLKLTGTPHRYLEGKNIEIGRASCRERVERWEGGGEVKKKGKRDGKEVSSKEQYAT